jgi:plasmid stability protein
MPAQTMTLDVPEAIYQRLQKRAQQKKRSVEDELLEVLATAVPVGDELPADLADAVSPLALLEDQALWRAARSRLPAETAAQLEALHFKRQREGLSEAEAQTLAHLVRQYERAMLIRAQAAALLHARGHDITELAASA